MRKYVKAVVSFLLVVPVALKWEFDRRRLPLQKDHWLLYLKLHVRSFIKLRRFPDIYNCNDYNEKIQWLKLFDQSEQHVLLSDKIRMKEFISSRLGEGFTPKTLYVLDVEDSLPARESLPENFVIKTNHDSGGVFISKGESESEVKNKLLIAQSRLSKPYGVDAGEWCYPLIQPKVFIEEYLDIGEYAPPDYKFHCANGRVAWLHYIYDRHTAAKEMIVLRSGEVTDLSLYPSMERGAGFSRPSNWDELVGVAERISEGFKYLRVDLYNLNGRIYVGELTVYPMGGFYAGEGQRKLSDLLIFDRSTVADPILSRRMNEIC